VLNYLEEHNKGRGWLHVEWLYYLSCHCNSRRTLTISGKFTWFRRNTCIMLWKSK